MKINLLLIFFLLFAIVKINAQTFTLFGDKCYGGIHGDFYPSIKLLNDGNLLLIGQDNNLISGNKTDLPCYDSLNSNLKDFWVIKINQNLNIIWDKSIGGSNEEREGVNISNDSNGNLLFIGCSRSDSSCEKSENNRDTSHITPTLDAWVFITDSVGTKVWDKTIGGTVDEEFANLVQSDTKDYFMVCRSSSIFPGGDKTVTNMNNSKDLWVVKFDSSFNKLWDNIYGGSGDEVLLGGYDTDAGIGLLKEDNGGILIATNTNSPIGHDVSVSPRGFYDYWLLKLDSAGIRVWDRRFGGSGYEEFKKIIHTKDHGYILCGETTSPQDGDITDSAKGGYDIWIVKLDSMGNKQWDKRYGGSGDEAANWIAEAPDSGYWVSGYTNSGIGGDISEPPYGNSGVDYWIFKIDNTGNKIFDKRFGGPGVNIGCNFVIMPDSSIYFCGMAGPGTSAVKTDSGYGSNPQDYNYWVVHFKYSTATVGIDELANFDNSISIYPNPAKDLLTINSSTEKIKQVELLNVLGENIYLQKVNYSNQTQINLQAYAPGFYLVRITGEKYTVVKRVVKE